MSNFAGKIEAVTTYIDMSTLELCNIEGKLYHGRVVKSPFSMVLQQSTWFAFGARELKTTGDVKNGLFYDLSPTQHSATDFLMYAWSRWVTPKIKLKNTPDTFTFVNDAGSIFPITGKKYFSQPKSSGIQDDQHDITSLTNEDIAVYVPRQRVYWTANLLHNFFQCLRLRINGRTIEELDRVWLDMYQQWKVPLDFKELYDQAIGNIPDLVVPKQATVGNGTNSFIPSRELQLDLPFSFSREKFCKGCHRANKTALPLLNLLCNNIEIQIEPCKDVTKLLSFERENVDPLNSATSGDWTSLSGVYEEGSSVNIASSTSAPFGALDTVGGLYGATSVFRLICRASNNSNDITGELLNTNEFLVEEKIEICPPRVYIKVATVTMAERLRHRQACRGKHILVEKVASLSQDDISPGSVAKIALEKIPGHIKAFYFNVENITSQLCGAWSNYTNDPLGFTENDSVSRVSIVYNSDSHAYYKMPADHFVLMEGIHHANTVPTAQGYHVWSKTLNLDAIQPAGGITASNSTAVQALTLELETKPTITIEEQLELQSDSDNNNITTVDGLVTSRYKVQVRAPTSTLILISNYVNGYFRNDASERCKCCV